MKFKVLVSFVFVVSMSVVCFAKSHFITPGARAIGYGQAFVAIADDLTAIYYNPAGLAYQEKTQVMASLFYIDYPATSDKLDTSVGSDKYETSAVVPFFAFSTPLPLFKETILAAGVYAIGGGGGKVKNLPAGYKMEGQQSFMVYNISLAKQLTDKFSVGLGFDAIQMEDKMVVNAYGIDYNRSAFGFQGNIGLMYKPVEKFSTAFVLRTGTYIGLPEEKNPFAIAMGTKNSYTYPLTAEVGAAYDFIDPLTVSCSVAWYKYSWSGVNYRDTIQVRIGSEYRATEKLSLLLGFFTDPNIIKDNYKDSYNLINLDMYDMNYLSVGAGYQFTDNLKLGLTLTHSFTKSIVYNGIAYEYDVNLGRFDISYKF